MTTNRTVYSQMVSPFRFTLKECAPMLHKFLGTRLGLKLGCQVAILFFKIGIFGLKLFYLFHESIVPFLQKDVALPLDVRASAFVNEIVPELGNIGDAHRQNGKAEAVGSKLQTP